MIVDVHTHFGFDPWQIAGPYGSPLIRLFAQPELPRTPQSPADIPTCDRVCAERPCR